MSELSRLSAVELKSLMEKGEISAREVVDSTYHTCARVEPAINAFVTLTPELAYASARAVDNARKGGQPLPALAGIPVSVKDIIPVAGVRFTAGSVIFKDRVAEADAAVVERVRKSGAGIVGKTTTSEFACLAVGNSPLTGVTRNPWKRSRTTGGSSAGAAASVAAGVTPIAVSTDGGGSSRTPASFCGVFGFKGQFGRIPFVPRSATPTTSHIGMMSRSVDDAVLLYSALAGYDPRDSHSVAAQLPDLAREVDAPLKGLRVAWSPTLGYGWNDPEVEALTSRAAAVFDQLGCSVTLVETVIPRDPVELFLGEFYVGVAHGLKDILAASAETMDPIIVEGLRQAPPFSLEEYMRLQSSRYELRDTMREFFESYDLLLCPTVPVPAFESHLPSPPQLPERNWISWQSYSYPFNLTGSPAATVPCGLTRGGLPVGLQIVGPILGELGVLRAARAFQRLAPWEQVPRGLQDTSL